MPMGVSYSRGYCKIALLPQGKFTVFVIRHPSTVQPAQNILPWNASTNSTGVLLSRPIAAAAPTVGKVRERDYFGMIST
jgi:hypothetical protein